MATMDIGSILHKVMLFCFFGALAALLPFLPLHMRSAGLSMEEARIISMVAPAVSLLGPLAVGPLADRLASGLWGQPNGSPDCGLKDYIGRAKGYRRLRALIAILMLLSAVAYCLLLLVVPVVTRRDARTPAVTFQCGSSPSGGVIVQERCADQCHDWGGVRSGSLMLTDCRYDCKELPEASLLESTSGAPEGATKPPATFLHPLETSDDDYDHGVEAPPETTTTQGIGTEGAVSTWDDGLALALYGSPTHLCFSDEDGAADCHAFYHPGNSLAINATMDGSLVGLDSMCVFPLSSFNVRNQVYSHVSCRPSAVAQCRVLCSVQQPIDEGPPLLGLSGPCSALLGDPELTFWSYLVVRSVADCFPAASLAVLGAAMLPPSPHAHPGRQLAFGALGAAAASPIVALLLAVQQQSTPLFMPNPWPPFAAFCVLAAVSALLLLTFQVPLLLGEGPVVTTASRKVPRLGPYPPAQASAHAGEAVALFLVLVLLGILWGGLDTFCPWYLSELMAVSSEAGAENITMVMNETMGGAWMGSTVDGWSPVPSPLHPLLLLIGLMVTTAALTAVPLLWHAEGLIDICGHANLLIIAFTFYIAHYAVLSFINNGWWLLISEALMAPVSMVLAWATAVHYTHLLFPPRWSATAQASAVVAHFCIGRCLGAVSGGLTWAAVGFKVFLQGGAIFAALVASLYFLVYHFCLKARCIGGAHGLRAGLIKAEGERPQGPTSNGNYTPLRVYHNGRGDAGKNRY